MHNATQLPLGFYTVNLTQDFPTDSRKHSCILPYNSSIVNLLHVIHPLCLMYKWLAVTALLFGERGTSGEVTAPVTFFKGSSYVLSHLSHPPL